jgi:ubiquinone biosynthesis protein
MTHARPTKVEGVAGGSGAAIATRRAQLLRAGEIATILWASGFRWLVAATGLESCVSLGCRVVCATGLRECDHHVAMDLPLPQRLRAVLERLGPTFVKAGQMLALRPDYVPLEYAEALRSLHDSVAPFSAREAERLIEQELGAPLARLFAEFDPEPIGAASLSQVHRALLPDGRAVAVKVQRPGIEAEISSDLELVAFLARRLERRRGASLSFRPTVAAAEFAEYTRRELDFRLEGRTAQRVRELHAGDPTVVIPAVDWERTTRRVLTMDLVEGVRPAPAAELAALGLDPHALLETGARAILRQIFEFGLFHADPHPGNVRLLEDDRIAFLDFGMFGRLTPRERRRMAFVFWALVEGDYEQVAEQLLRLSALAPGADPDGFRAALGDLVGEWYGSSSTRFSIARLLLRQLALGGRYGVVFPRQLMLLARALVNVESTASVIDPGLTLAELARPLLPELRHSLLLDPHTLEEAWQRNRFDYLELALELPDLLPELAERLRGGASDSVAVAPPAPRGRGITGALAAGVAGGLIGAALSRRRHPYRADAAAR